MCPRTSSDIWVKNTCAAINLPVVMFQIPGTSNVLITAAARVQHATRRPRNLTPLASAQFLRILFLAYQIHNKRQYMHVEACENNTRPRIIARTRVEHPLRVQYCLHSCYWQAFRDIELDQDNTAVLLSGITACKLFATAFIRGLLQCVLVRVFKSLQTSYNVSLSVQA